MIPEDFVRRMIGVERMRNIVLRQDLSKIRAALGFDRWSATNKPSKGGFIAGEFADSVAMEKHIAHLEDDLYHAQQTKLVERESLQRELQDLRLQLEEALNEQAAGADAKVSAYFFSY